jgi:hypothetical protein
MIEETTVGLMAIKESHCFSKSGNRIPFGSAGTAGAQLDRNRRTGLKTHPPRQWGGMESVLHRVLF